MQANLHSISVILAALFSIGLLVSFSLLEPTRKEHTYEVELHPEKELMKRQNSNGIWSDASSTALSSYVLLSAQENDQINDTIKNQKEFDSWTNYEGYEVSVGNYSVPNSIEYLTQTTALNSSSGGFSNDISESSSQDLSQASSQAKFAYQFESSSETKSFYLLAFLEYSKNKNIDNITSPTIKTTINNTINYTIQAILDAQLPNGSWNYSIYETALALHALAQAQALPQNNSSIQLGISYLNTSYHNIYKNHQASDNQAFALDLSLTIIALSDFGYDIENMVECLIKLQNENGSFGNLETSTWAYLALSRSSSPQAKKACERLSSWLGNWLGIIDKSSLSDRDLALISIAESDSGTSFRYLNKEYSKDTSQSNTPYLIAVILFFSLTFAIGLFARLDSRDIFAGVRKDIFDYIREHPGEHVSAIMKEFNLSPSSVEYHLKVLEKNAQITYHKDSKFKRYYINGSGLRNTSEYYKDIMSVLKNPTSRKVVQFLIVNNRSKQKELADSLGLSPSTINWHANRLKECKIIEVKRIGKETFYEINQKDVITKILSIISADTA